MIFRQMIGQCLQSIVVFQHVVTFSNALLVTALYVILHSLLPAAQHMSLPLYSRWTSDLKSTHTRLLMAFFPAVPQSQTDGHQTGLCMPISLITSHNHLHPVIQCSNFPKTDGGLSAELVDLRHVRYMWCREGNLLDPTVGGGDAPLLQNLRFLISKRRTFVNC